MKITTAEERAISLVYGNPELDNLLIRAKVNKREWDEFKSRLHNQIANEIRDAEMKITGLSSTFMAGFEN